MFESLWRICWKKHNKLCVSCLGERAWGPVSEVGFEGVS